MTKEYPELVSIKADAPVGPENTAYRIIQTLGRSKVVTPASDLFRLSEEYQSLAFDGRY